MFYEKSLFQSEMHDFIWNALKYSCFQLKSGIIFGNCEESSLKANK